MSAANRPIHEQAMALLNTATLVSIVDLAKALNMTPNNLAGKLRQRVITGQLVREVKIAPTGPARSIGFYRLSTTKEMAPCADVVAPDPVSTQWNNPFALGGRA